MLESSIKTMTSILLFVYLGQIFERDLDTAFLFFRRFTIKKSPVEDDFVFVFWFSLKKKRFRLQWHTLPPRDFISTYFNKKIIKKNSIF